MKNLFFFLVFLANMGMAYATIPGLPFAILVDTAYVSNDMHIELAYRVLVPFEKIHLSVHTSMDDLDAGCLSVGSNWKQASRDAKPVFLSGSPGKGRTSVPINLLTDEATHFNVFIAGGQFADKSDTAVYESFFLIFLRMCLK